MSTKFKEPMVWFTGLLAAFLAGGAAAASAGISGIVIAPDKFNLNDGLGNTLKMVATSFVISGLFGFFQRLQKSPLPEVVTTDTVMITKESVAGGEPTITTTQKTSVSTTEQPEKKNP